MVDKLNLELCMSCHCLAARRKARELTRIYEAKLRPYGLKATQFSILIALAAVGPKPISVLASSLGLERTTLTRGAALLARPELLQPHGRIERNARRFLEPAAITQFHDPASGMRGQGRLERAR